MPDSPLPESSPAESGPLVEAWAERLARWRAALPEPTWPRMAVAAAAAVALLGALLFVTRRPDPAPLVLPRAVPESAGPGASGPPDASDSAPKGSPPSSAPAAIAVHAAGAVVRPGVYAVSEGARVADVIAAAGGTQPDADIDQVNLAAKVADAERIYLPRKGETPPAGPPPGPVAGAAGAGAVSGGTAPAPGPLDLNAATAEQLDTLPGVGPATSQAILQYRTSHGRFRSVDDLLEVRGIGPAKLEALRPLVRV